MTAAQWIEAVRLYNRMWRNNPLPKATIDEWYKRLNHLPGRRVWDAINHLADTADYPPDLAVIKATCAKLARDEQMAAPLDRPALPKGQTRWDRLSDDERQPYIDQALEAWHGFAKRRDSPLVVGMARHLANGGSLTPSDPTPAGRCRCGGRLMLDDRATMTAKCDRCHCDFILEAA